MIPEAGDGAGTAQSSPGRSITLLIALKPCWRKRNKTFRAWLLPSAAYRRRNSRLQVVGDDFQAQGGKLLSGDTTETLCDIVQALSMLLTQRETLRLEKLMVMPPRQFSLSFDGVFQSFRSFPEEMRLLPHAPDA